jgi:hypothetical protein
MLGRLVRRTPLMDERLRESWIRHADSFLSEYDVLVTPALAQPPINARRWFSGGWASTMLANIRYAPFAAPWNVAGMPAIVIPMGVHPHVVAGSRCCSPSPHGWSARGPGAAPRPASPTRCPSRERPGYRGFRAAVTLDCRVAHRPQVTHGE